MPEFFSYILWLYVWEASLDLKERSLNQCGYRNAYDDEITVCWAVKYCIYRGSCIWYGTDPACDGISDHQMQRNVGIKKILFFSPNGVAGLVFYGFLVLTIVLLYEQVINTRKYHDDHFPWNSSDHVLIKRTIRTARGRKETKAEGGVGMFLVQGFFELFETMLSFFSNTISFVRIGAFAVSHAAMMEVVLMLGGITDGAGNPNWIIIVLGNIIVCGLEGLVVGIQVLRLEYYEMFSRFYTGSGREFHPYDNHAGKEN